MSSTLDGVRFAIGTLTRLPVAPPSRINARTTSIGITLAPVVGLGVGVIAELVALATRWSIPGWDDRLLVAVVSIVALAAITGGIHLDGLADTADGLGSGKSGVEALAIMRRSDVGAFGVTALVLMLLLQVAALNTALLQGRGSLALIGGTVVSRLAVTWACRRGQKSARTDGLGASVIGVVPRSSIALMTAIVGLGLAAATIAEDDVSSIFVVNTLVACAVSLTVAMLFVRYCSKRLGGITGDVLGATNELTFAVFVFAIALR